MNIAVLLLIILSSWRWGDWKNWQKYHPTMLLAIIGNLLYNVVYCDHYLWRILPGILQSFILTEMLYTFIILPLTAMMFLSNYPDSLGKQVFHILKYIFVYSLIEYIYYLYGMIFYQFGWNFWWSVGWNFMMFSIWSLHYKKPIKAYIISLIIFTFIIILFPFG
ncbi:MAG: hypothetical protein K0R50_2002 [Eubacterium sp.]|nr:hypothetical protein [Eubacterium sp.]